MQLIDAEYVAGRFLVRVRLPDGSMIRLNADTGGGLTIDPQVSAKLPRYEHGLETDLEAVRFAVEPPIEFGRDFAFVMAAPGDDDGNLPSGWFFGRIWSFDHRTGRLAILDRALESEGAPLGFQAVDGHRTTNFARITVNVDGENLDLLLDTGATIVPTDAGADALGGSGTQASSFITDVVFRRWQQRHPDWPVVPGGSTLFHSALIRVPEIMIGELALGPVWFEHRPDRNFHEHMSQWMDRRIDGALGGNAFTGRRLVIDFPGARAFVD